MALADVVCFGGLDPRGGAQGTLARYDDSQKVFLIMRVVLVERIPVCLVCFGAACSVVVSGKK